MFGLKQFLRKKNGMCPICAVPYVREKRDLKASYFDVSCSITVWTLHCPECGYEVILPGIAQIRKIENSKQGIDGSGDATQPVVTITGTAIEGGAAGDKESRISQTGNGMNPASAVDRSPEYNADTDGIGEGTDVATVADVQEDTHPVPGADTGNQKTDTSGSPVLGADAIRTGDAVSARDKASTADTVDTAVLAEPTTKEGGLEEKSAGRIPEFESSRGKKKSAGVAEERQDGAGAAQEKHESRPNSRSPETIGKDAAKRIRGEGKAGRRNTDKDIGSETEPDRKTAPGKTPQGQGPSGFPNSSIFPSSAISNLDMLRTSIQTGTDKKASLEKKEGTRAAAPAHESKEKFARDSARGWESGTPREESGRKPDGAAGKLEKAHEKPEFSADNKKTDGQQNGPKSLSAENRTRVPSPGLPAGESGKNKEKQVSVENIHTAGLDGNGGAVEVSTVKNHEGGQKDSAMGADGRDETEKPDLEKSKGADKDTAGTGKADISVVKKPEERENHDAEKAGDDVGNGGTRETKENQDGRESHKDPMETAMVAAKKFQEKIPAGFTEKIPVLSQISKQQKRSLFVSEEKRYLDEHIPHKQAIINDLIYDTDNSEMFLRSEGQYGLDNPCVHYNYRTQNGNFFRCTVKYKHEDSIRVLDIIETKRMLEEYPDIYKKFFPDSVADA